MPAEHPSAFVDSQPDKPAVIMATSGDSRTYRELEARSNQVAHALRAAGLHAGDHVAVIVQNRIEWYDAVWGALRAGLYVTPVNWHLTAAEAGYIVENSESKAVFADAGLGETIAAMSGDLGGVSTRVSIGGDMTGFEPLSSFVDGHSDEPIDDEQEGAWMFYSSGTTGRPKGIKPPTIGTPLGAPTAFSMLLSGLYGFTPDTVYLSPAPLYHASPAGWTTMTQRLGGTAIVMERFEPVEFLHHIERFGITHVQVVPTHLVRLLKLPKEEREQFDLSSLQLLVHAAAPCPPEVKRATIEWLGPKVFEFYSGSEGGGFCAIGPEEWLAHPGSVGKSLMGAVHILDEDGTELGVGETGQVWFEAANKFEYHNDPAKTASAWKFDKGWSTLGDIGHVDEDGYLYLTDRVANMIISGGVNIYPQEAENVLIMHPAIDDVGVVGIPDADMGERVCAFVQATPGSTLTEDEVITFARDRLTHYKCPTEVRFVESLPRLPTGKLLKRLLMD